MSDDVKKIAEDLASKVAGNAIKLKDDPPPPPPRTERSSLWDEDWRPSEPKRYTYQRDRWSKPTPTRSSGYDPRYAGSPFPWTKPTQEVPKPERPGYTDADIDWEFAKTVRIQRHTTWTDFLIMLGLDYMNEARDGETFKTLRGIFLQRKGDTFRQ